MSLIVGASQSYYSERSGGLSPSASPSASPSESPSASPSASPLRGAPVHPRHKTRDGRPRPPHRTALGLPFAGNVAMLVLDTTADIVKVRHRLQAAHVLMMQSFIYMYKS